MAVKNRYIAGQGEIFLDEIDPITKKAMGKARFVGNVPDGGFMVTIAVTKYEHAESYTGNQLIDLSIERNPVVTGMLRLESYDLDNLKFCLYGQSSNLATATVSAEAHKAYKGYSFQLNRLNLTSFTSLTNTGGTPASYEVGTDYTVDLKSGMVTILEAGDIPDNSDVRANYVAGAAERVNGFTSPNKELYLIYNGVNLAEDRKPFKLEVFRARFQPAKTLDLITPNNAIANLELDFTALYEDALNDQAGFEGGFFRMTQTV
jgi:hypothetical protein